MNIKKFLRNILHLSLFLHRGGVLLRPRSISATLRVVLGGSLLTLLTACTENKDLQVRDAFQPPHTGHVSIVPKWATVADITRLRYCFYPTGETPGEAIYADGTTNGFEGELPAGTYRMVAYNAHADGVRFVGTDHWQTAAVELIAVATRNSYNLVNQMPQVFAAAPQEVLTVLAGQKQTTNLGMRKLTKTLILGFTTNANITVSHLTGTLCGVYPTLLLATDQPTATATQAAPHTAVCFELQGGAAGEKKTQLSISGLLDPQNGTCYDNRLTLEVTTDNGEQWNTFVDLNGTITSILEENGGILPNDMPIEMNIKISRTLVGVSAIVCGWGDGGNGDTEL